MVKQVAKNGFTLFRFKGPVQGGDNWEGKAWVAGLVSDIEITLSVPEGIPTHPSNPPAFASNGTQEASEGSGPSASDRDESERQIGPKELRIGSQPNYSPDLDPHEAFRQKMAREGVSYPDLSNPIGPWQGCNGDALRALFDERDALASKLSKVALEVMR